MAYQAFDENDPRRWRRRRDWADVVEDGETVRTPMFMMDGQPTAVTQVVEDAYGQPVVTLTPAARQMRDAARAARDAELSNAWRKPGRQHEERAMIRDDGTVTFGPGVAGEPAHTWDPQAEVSPETAKKLRELAYAQRDEELQNAWRTNKGQGYGPGPQLSPGQLDLVIRESLVRYGLLK